MCVWGGVERETETERQQERCSICLCVGVSAHIHFYEEAKCQVFSCVAFCLILFRKNFSLNLELAVSSFHSTLVCVFHGSGWQTLHGCLGSELKSSGLQSKCFNPSHLSSLFSLIVVNLVSVRWFLIAVLISISLWLKRLSILSDILWNTYLFSF